MRAVDGLLLSVQLSPESNRSVGEMVGIVAGESSRCCFQGSGASVGSSQGRLCLAQPHERVDEHLRIRSADQEMAGHADAVEYHADAAGHLDGDHGIGTAKLSHLHLNRTEAELAAFSAIKRALDPAGLLNPHVLLP